MLALGLANIASGFLGGLAGGGSLSQTAVNDGAGAKTEMSPIVAAVLSLVTVIALTPLFHDLPEAVLGALDHPRGVTPDAGRRDALASTGSCPASSGSRSLTLVSVLVLDVLPALLIGVVVSLVLLIGRASLPKVSVLGRNPSTPGVYDDIDRHPIRYEDPRLSRSIVGQRVARCPPAWSAASLLPLPELAADGSSKNAPTLTVVETTDGTALLGVADDLGIVQRYHDAVCFEITVRRVVDLERDDVVPSDDDIGTLTLIARLVGPGTLEILRVGATPVLKNPTTTTWRLDRVVSGTGPTQRIELPVPARCDSHAFFEAGGATAFRLRLRLDGEESEYVLRMSQTGAQAAIAYAIDACGLAD